MIARHSVASWPYDPHRSGARIKQVGQIGLYNKRNEIAIQKLSARDTLALSLDPGGSWGGGLTALVDNLRPNNNTTHALVQT